jgi:LysM repeat protein
VPSLTGTIIVPTAISGRPASYTLQKGEFPYCIARRFDVDPSELLALNRLARGDIYYPNLTLKIPQSGDPFPPPRQLNNRPDTYTVADPSMTLYGVACYYGDIDPATIAQANNLPLTAVLSVGQRLAIP